MLAFMPTNRDPRAAQIEDRLNKSGRSLRWLAGRIGESPQKVHNWITGINSPRDPEVWNQMLDVVRTAVSEGAARSKGIALHRAGTRVIPVYAGMRAGEPGSYDGDVDWIEVKDWGNNFDRWGRLIEGYSMDPLILPGDVVIFETVGHVLNGHVVHAFSDDGEDTCKVFDGQYLRPVNPDFEPIRTNAGQKWTVKGVAVMIIRKIEHGGTVTYDYPSGLRHKIP